MLSISSQSLSLPSSLPSSLTHSLPPSLLFPAGNGTYLLFGNHVFLNRVSPDGTGLQVLATDRDGNIVGVDYDYRSVSRGGLELPPYKCVCPNYQSN